MPEKPKPIDRTPQFERIWREVRDRFAAADVAEIAARTGLAGEDGFRVPYLDRAYRVQHPEGTVHGPSEPDPVRDLVRRTLLLRYLLGFRPSRPAARWAPYREVKGGDFHPGGEFQADALAPLIERFGLRPEAFSAAAGILGGERVDFGDPGYAFEVLPGIRIAAALYPADDEDPPSANIVFSPAPLAYLPGDDIIFLAKDLVRRLLDLA